MLRFSRLVFLTLSLLVAQCVWSQVADSLRVDSTRVYHIDEVSISVRRYEPRALTSAQVLSGVALQRLNSHSVADALRYFTGVQIKDYGGIGGLKTVNIRSMGSNHVGVFYDGVEIGNAQNGTVDLGRFSLENMEAVTVYNGEKSGTFQPAKDFGSAGSVYLQSRVPQFSDGKPYNVLVGLKGGSFFTVNPSVLWEQRLSERVSMSLSAEYLYTTGRYKFRYRTKNGYDTTAVRQNGDVSALRGELGFFGQLSGGSWRAKAYVYNSERGYPGAIVRGKFSNAARQWDTNVFLQSQLKKSFSDCYSLMLTAKYAYDFVHYLSDTTRNLAEFFSDNHFRQHEIYLSNANRWQPFPWWSIGLSVDFQWNKLDADLDRFVFPQRFLTLAALSTGFDFPHVKLQASVLGTFVSDRTQAETAPPLWKFTPAVFLNYQPSLKVDLKLRAFFKQSMRLPTFNDLYYTLVGNSRLKPENTTQYDIGLSFNQPINAWFSLFSLQIDGYFNQISDKIVAMPTSNFFRWTMLNLGKVEIWGTDVAVQTTFRPVEKMLLDLRATYTFQSATDRSNAKASTWGGQIPYIPRHAASCTFSGSYADWSLTYSFVYTGERYDSSANVAANYIQPWYTHDVALNWQHRWPKFGLKLTAEVNNLLNQQYDVVRNYPMPGTNFRLCAKIQL